MTHATCFAIKPPPPLPQGLWFLLCVSLFFLVPMLCSVDMGGGEGGQLDFLLMSHRFTSGLSSPAFSKEACFFVEFITVTTVKVSYIQVSR